MDGAPFEEAAELLREPLEFLATQPAPESVLPALRVYATAARRAGMSGAALEMHFRTPNATRPGMRPSSAKGAMGYARGSRLALTGNGGVTLST